MVSAEGFKRGEKLDKVGQDAADTSELFFDDVFVPANNLLGGEEARTSTSSPSSCRRNAW